MNLLLRGGGYYKVVCNQMQLEVTILPVLMSLFILILPLSYIYLKRHLSFQRACQVHVPSPAKKMSLVNSAPICFIHMVKLPKAPK